MPHELVAQKIKLVEPVANIGGRFLVALMIRVPWKSCGAAEHLQKLGGLHAAPPIGKRKVLGIIDITSGYVEVQRNQTRQPLQRLPLHLQNLPTIHT